MLVAPASHPAADYAAGLAAARAFVARDDVASILPEARSALFDCGKRTPLAVVLLHGLTNNPAQYAVFAPQLHALGVNVFVPRMPEHGKRDRMTTGIANLTAEMLLESASEALDIASGLGERVAVLGISMGGVLAAYFAQHRAVDVAVPVAPDFALLQLPYGLSYCVERLGLLLPNFFLWWDPRVKGKLLPHTSYPRFSTHALMQTLRIADDVVRAAREVAPQGARITTIVNRCDPAVNNQVARSVSDAWCARTHGSVEFVEMHDLPEWHDIIQPHTPNARIEIVYPRLLRVLTGEASVHS